MKYFKFENTCQPFLLNLWVLFCLTVDPRGFLDPSAIQCVKTAPILHSSISHNRIISSLGSKFTNAWEEMRSFQRAWMLLPDSSSTAILWMLRADFCLLVDCLGSWRTGKQCMGLKPFVKYGALAIGNIIWKWDVTMAVFHVNHSKNESNFCYLMF